MSYKHGKPQGGFLSELKSLPLLIFIMRFVDDQAEVFHVSVCQIK